MTNPPEAISHDKVLTQFKNLVAFQRDHGAKQAAVNRKLTAIVGDAAFAEAIATGGENLSDMGAEVAALRQEQAMLDLAARPVKAKLIEILPLVCMEIYRLREELEGIHKECGDHILGMVSNLVQKAMPGMLQPAEYRWVILRSTPMREQAHFEAMHPAIANISFVRGPHPVTGEMTDVPDPFTIENPQIVTGKLEQLEAGIEAAKARRDQLKRYNAA